MQVAERLAEYLQNRPAQIRQLKKQGKKVVGHFAGEFVPEELIYASGAVPICLVQGGDSRAVQAAHTVAPRFLCAFSKAQIGERLLAERPYYQMVDLIVAPISCQHLHMLADMWECHTPVEVFRLGIPHENTSEHGLQYYLERLKALKEKLEALTGQKITNSALSQAIRQFNGLRAKLRQISLMREAQPPRISSRDFVSLNQASLFLQPEDTMEILDLALEELAHGNGSDATRSRLLLTGPCLAYGDYKVLELAEKAGADIVMEEFCEGLRSYWQEVSEKDDPLEALARRYLTLRVPCAFMRETATKRFEHLKSLAHRFNASGILWYQLLYCDTYDMESYFITPKMREVGLPVLVLESDYDAIEGGPMKTRIEAFLETIRGGPENG